MATKGRKKGGVPELRRHKPSGRAVVRLNGDDHYLGPWPDGLKEAPPEARASYDVLIARWLAGRREPLPTAEGEKRRLLLGQAGSSPGVLTVAELAVRYAGHARTYYSHPDGSPTSEYHEVVYSLRPLVHLFCQAAAADVGPMKLKAVRELMIAGYHHPKYGDQPPLSRGVINARCRRIARAYRWAASEELVPASVYQSLRTVSGLTKGRTQAREREPVGLVAPDAVEKASAHLTNHLRGVVRFQLLTGARPTEALTVRLADLDRSSPVWLYRPATHKTAYRGKARVIAIGPKCQALLMEYVRIRCPLCGVEGRPPRIGSRDLATCGPCRDRLDEADLAGPMPRTECQDASDHLFSPAVAMRERDEDRRAARKTRVQPSQVNRKKPGAKRRPGKCYQHQQYARAIVVACEKAGVEPWAPNRLRHNHASLVRKEFGLEAAQVALGHSRADVTQVYAERDLTLAARVAREIG